ncbi:MAG: ribosome biogenesis GTPase YlqF [Defluviitaleaceae bacterium]|nr:ribosome biogenesis GTPase YlqF [Defluviitaleaceae bacterium]
MTKTKRMLATQMKIIDVVVELLDARVPLSSRNPDIDTLAKDKRRVLVLNKADLADEKITAQWEEYFSDMGFFALAVNAKESKKKSGATNLITALKKTMADKVEKQKQRGRINAPIRAMIVGIPNVGKSTFINHIVGRAGAIAADRPGVTRGRQWLKVGGEFDLMDTPGVLWPKFDDPMVGIRLACTGAVNDDILDRITLANHLIQILESLDTMILQKRYKANTLETIGEVRGFKMKGGVVDLERTAITLLDEFRGGKLGRITLELPN